MKTLYTEELGPATVSLVQYGDSWIAKLEDTSIIQAGEPLHVERTFHGPDAYDKALDAYDKTCEYAAKLYSVTRPLPPMPDFVSAILR